MREALVDYVRDAHRRATGSGRGEPTAYVEAAAHAFDPDALTIGFARRVAAYKRLRPAGRTTPRAP